MHPRMPLVDLTEDEDEDENDSEEYDQVIQVRVEIYLQNSLVLSAYAMCRLHETIQSSKAVPRRIIKRTADNIFVISTLGDTRKCRMVIFLSHRMS